MLKFTVKMASTAALLAIASPLVAQDAAAPGPNTVVATVNGTEITLGQMIISRSQLPPQYQQLPDEVLFEGVLDQLIQQQVLADTLEADPTRVTIALQNERRGLLAGEVINSVVEEAMTDEAIQAIYDELVLGAGPAQEFNASHILVETEEESAAVVARLNAGEAFADLARELSLDPGSGANGGELGWFGLGMMVPPFEQAVSDLEVGAVSDPVQTQFGWHIIQLNDKRDMVPPTLEEVREELESQVRQNAIEDLLSGLLDEAVIVRPEDGAFDPSVLLNLGLLSE